MHKTAVLNVVGLTPDLVKKYAPFLRRWADAGKSVPIRPVLPAVTSSVQATYLTGSAPSEHGIVGNGWYFRDTSEVRFWLRSGQLIQGEKIWDKGRSQSADFTCANLFWRHAAYSGADYVVVERPQYFADGRKEPDIYAQPSGLREELQHELGTFPLFEFWGPNTTIRSSQWIAEAAKRVQTRFSPTLSLVYLPHLDYVLQKQGPGGADVPKHVKEIDEVCRKLIQFYEKQNVRVIVLSEYGIEPVSRPIHLNRVLRKSGFLTLREERGGELLDAGACEAFAVADHQVAHIYVQDPARLGEVRQIVASTPGVEQVLDATGKKSAGLDHSRSGDLIALAERDAWFTYYYWLDDDKAPDFARSVAIHDKPGFDPVEMFLDPELPFPRGRVVRRVLQKKLGFRYVMDVIPLDASLVKGSHGRLPASPEEGPVFITRFQKLLKRDALDAIDVTDLIERHLFE